MKLQKTLVVSFTAALALMGGATGAYAGDDTKFQNNTQILSCDVVEVIDIPILSSANNNIDCSENYKKEVKVEKKVKFEKDHKFTFAPKLEQAQGQGQGQKQDAKAEQGQKQDAEAKQKQKQDDEHEYESKKD